MSKIKRALISVSNKEGVVEFAKELEKFDVEILSTGGTKKKLKEAGIKVKSVSEYTGFPEMLDGRVKTLHPKIHAGLLAQRDNPEHIKQMKEHNIESIDLVVINLYPFEQTIKKQDVTLEEAIENIDIGGPTMLRSAAKNYKDVVVICNPKYYSVVIEEIKRYNGQISEETKRLLAYEVFTHTSHYDRMISDYLKNKFNIRASINSKQLILEKIQELRYGENPHQKASFYRLSGFSGGVSGAKQLHGKELSFNNILDLEAAYSIALEFEEPVSIIIKHTNPCGVAIGNSLLEAYRNAHMTDPVSAFGSVVGFNKEVDKEVAQQIVKTFVEAVIAPMFKEEALNILKQKKNIRLMQADFIKKQKEDDYKTVSGGGILIQDKNDELYAGELKTVTKRKPTDEEMEALRFAWKVCKHVKSNAIVYTTKDRTIGIGAGQMSRVDASEIAVMKANKSGLSLKGTVLASDAFFPFRDGVDAAANAGATAIIQPGGSLRDKEVISACDEHNIAMVFTGIRHFRH